MNKTQLTLFDVICLGINAIVGAGIYTFPGELAAWLGPISFLAFGLCGVVAAPIGLCFAEAAGMFDQTGGPYLYAEAAFGRTVGYLVGWTCWVAAILSWAAVARAVPPYLGQLWPLLNHAGVLVLLPAVLVIILGGINFYGLRSGALTTDLLTITKLAPLLLLLGAGIYRRRPELTVPLAPHGFSALPRATFHVLFAFQGFEVVPVPSGETANPRRNAPAALLLSLLFSTLLYMALQWAAVTSTPTLPGSTQPLAEMGKTVLGALGGQLTALAAIISMVGFCAGVALAGPRYVEALALAGFLPASIASRHPRHATPHHAIVLTTLLTVLLVFVLKFERLVDLSVLTVSIQYLSTSLAVLILRRRLPEKPRTVRLPGGPIIPVVSIGVTFWLGMHAQQAEVLLCLAIWCAGMVPWLIKRVGI